VNSSSKFIVLFTHIKLKLEECPSSRRVIDGGTSIPGGVLQIDLHVTQDL
jgi:hypothetical protein